MRWTAPIPACLLGFVGLGAGGGRHPPVSKKRPGGGAQDALWSTRITTEISYWRNQPGTISVLQVKMELESNQWAKRQAQIKAESNGKRSKATKEQPRTEDGKRLSGLPSVDGRPGAGKKHHGSKSHCTSAKEAGVSEATMARAREL